MKVISGIALIAVLVGVALAWHQTTGLQSRDPAAIKVVINQPPATDGVVPIEIIQPIVFSSAPNKLDDFTYTLRNNSNKPIKAVAVVRTLNYEEGGKVYAHSVYSTMDTAFHADFGGKPFLPGSQMPMESAGPLSFDDGVIIKEITLTLEYASYDDQTAYGPGGEGERRIKECVKERDDIRVGLLKSIRELGNHSQLYSPTIQASRHSRSTQTRFRSNDGR